MHAHVPVGGIRNSLPLEGIEESLSGEAGREGVSRSLRLHGNSKCKCGQEERKGRHRGQQKQPALPLPRAPTMLLFIQENIRVLRMNSTPQVSV